MKNSKVGITVLGSLVSGVLPTTRHLRPILFSGLLWILVFWLLFGTRIPGKEASTGLVTQVYSAAAFIGPIGIVAVVAVGVFIVGTLAGPVDGLIVRLFDTFLLSPYREQVRWRRYVGARNRQISEQLRLGKTQLTDAKASEQGSDNPEGQKKLTRLSDRVDELEGQAEKLRRRWLMKRDDLSEIVGKMPADIAAEVELIRAARERGAAEYFTQRSWHEPESVIRWYERQHTADELALRLHEELSGDPLEVLYGLDESLWSELARERSERETRLSVALPMIAAGLVIATHWSAVGWIILCIATVLFVRSVPSSADERRRVVQLLNTRNLEPLSVRAAVGLGRKDAYEHILTREITQRSQGTGASSRGLQIEAGPPSAGSSDGVASKVPPSDSARCDPPTDARQISDN